MSRSRSPTPKPNTIASSSTSRPVPTDDENTTPPTPTRERSALPAQTNLTESVQSPDITMARQLRSRSRSTTQRSVRTRPDDDSTSSSSQDGRSDQEDTGPVSEELQTKSAPAKQKRTRTLTTPHQAAVLHALLAESRFPTTTVREEVGRTIGLSARKVQIWFQNQRQKARRPHSATRIEPVNGAQYGVFPNLYLDASRIYPSIPEQGSSSSGSSRSYNDAATFEEQQKTPATASASYEALVGPGMSGRDDMVNTIPPIRTPPPVFRSPRAARRPHPYHEQHASDYSQSRSPVLQPPLREHSSLFSRTLPPLVYNDRPLSRSISGPPTTTNSGGFDSPFRRTSPTDSLFAHRPPELAQLHAPLPLALPPPFTLQPQPQWDNTNATFNTTRPHSSPWNRTSFNPPPRSSSSASYSNYGRSSLRLPALSTIFDRPTFESADLPRSGRYDPVRGLFMLSPTSEPGIRSPRSPTQD